VERLFAWLGADVEFDWLGVPQVSPLTARP
jgi:hypothetical protein